MAWCLARSRFWLVLSLLVVVAAVLVLYIFGMPLVAGAQGGKTSRIGVPSFSAVAEVRITFETVDVVIGAYDRVRYKLAVEALGEDGQRVDVRTSALVIVESGGEILWLGGTEWFDFGRGDGGSVTLAGISDGFLWSSTVKLRVVGFADDKVATDAIVVLG